MKKLISALSVTSFLSFAPSAFADDPVLNTCANGFSGLCNLGVGDFGRILGLLIQLIFVVAIVAALLYLVWGGFKWITSGGDKGAVTQAREHIVAAIIGLVVIFLSYFILNLLLNFFSLGNINNLPIPNI